MQGWRAPGLDHVIEPRAYLTTGLAVACVGYLWANRLVPLGIGHQTDWELRIFYGLWLLTLVHALLRAPTAAWREQLGLFAGLCLLLPVLTVLSTGDHLPAQWMRRDWESAGVELMALAFGFAALGALRALHRRDERDRLGSVASPAREAAP